MERVKAVIVSNAVWFYVRYGDCVCSVTFLDPATHARSLGAQQGKDRRLGARVKAVMLSNAGWLDIVLGASVL